MRTIEAKCRGESGRHRPGTSPGLLLLLLALPLAIFGCVEESDFVSYESRSAAEEHSLELGGETISLEVALNSAQRSQGLKNRPAMPENHGMLFAFPKGGCQRFWMKDTFLPLSIAFITVDGTIGTIANIEDLEPHEESPGAISHEEVTFALEMNKGWFGDHGVTAGTTIELPEWVLDLPVE